MSDSKRPLPPPPPGWRPPVPPVTPATAALDAASAAANASAGLIRSIVAALERPIYSDASTIVRTWVEMDRNGKAHTLTETRTKGWTVPLGLPVLALGVAAAWEVGCTFAAAWEKQGGGSPNPQTNPLLALLDPTSWLVSEVFDPSTGTTKKASVPPSAMGTWNALLANFLSPAQTGAGVLSAKLVANLAEQAAPPSNGAPAKTPAPPPTYVTPPAVSPNPKVRA